MTRDPRKTAPPQSARRPEAPPASALQALVDEAFHHRALNHDWITSLAAMEGEALRLELQAFASWYSGYSQWFPHYLRAVIEGLADEGHRRLLQDNLDEERGKLGDEERAKLRALGIDPQEVDGVPHPLLFERFCDALGVDPQDHVRPPLETQHWRSAFRRLLEQGGSAVAVGALGLGTETIVTQLYRGLLEALRRAPGLSRADYVFFELHCHVDDQHQADLLSIAGDLAARPGGLEGLREGMLKALDMRAEFWDALAARRDTDPAPHTKATEMTESTAELYDHSSDRWQRSAPVLLSDFTARPFVLDWCAPLEGAKVLDIGCGEGYVARQLLERGAASVHGIDISKEMVGRAQEQEAGQERPLTYAAGDATNLEGQASDSYDLVVAVFLFNYLTRAQTEACMSEVARVLRPGGRFVFAVPHPSLAFVREEERPFYFSRGDAGYFSGRDTQFEGKIWRRDGEGVRVRCVHKTLDDYFTALGAAGFRTLPKLRELHVTEEHLALDPGFFEPLREVPLHVAFQLER